MTIPLDDIPDELLDLTTKASSEFGLNKKHERLLEYVRKNIPVRDIADVLTEDLWLREVLKDIDSKNPGVRSNALRMLGSYMGLLANRGNKAGRKVVEFE